MQKDARCCILISSRKKYGESLEFYPRNLAVSCLPGLSSLEAFHGFSSVPSTQASPVVSTFLRTTPLPPVRWGTGWLPCLLSCSQSHGSAGTHQVPLQRNEHREGGVYLCVSTTLVLVPTEPHKHVNVPGTGTTVIVRDAQCGCWGPNPGLWKNGKCS